MEELKIVAFTHKNLELDEIGLFHLEDKIAPEKLAELKQVLGVSELMYLSTCNRVEFITVSSEYNLDNITANLIGYLLPELGDGQKIKLHSNAETYIGQTAVKHLFKVASSLDSLVVGEREIITQLRTAYDKSKAWNLSGDSIRLIIRKTIETAKEVYTYTDIATKPVSIVSLAYRKLQEQNIPLDARFLIIGSGQTNQTMSKFLKKHGFKNFTIYNRTLANAEKLAKELNGKAYALNDIEKHKGGFDAILTCTSSAGAIITKSIYTQLLENDNSNKTIIDLAIPNDLSSDILAQHPITYISINELKKTAAINLAEREKEIVKCDKIIFDNLDEFKLIWKQRHLERALSEIPEKVRAISNRALNNVFAKDINNLDQDSKTLVEEIVLYMEKKCISVPMKMAREIMIEQNKNNGKAH